jgi:hypothetical protein
VKDLLDLTGLPHYLLCSMYFRGIHMSEISTCCLVEQIYHLRRFLVLFSFTSQNNGFIRNHLLRKHGGQFRLTYVTTLLDEMLQTQRAVCCRSFPVSHERTAEDVFSFEDCSNVITTADTFQVLINALHEE